MRESVSTRDLFKALYREGRDTVAADVRDVHPDMLRWRGIDPSGVVTMGSLLLHVAGVDSMVRYALQGGSLGELTALPEWMDKFGPGFPRELAAVGVHVEPPDDLSLADCLAILAAETEATLQFVATTQLDLMDETPFYRDGCEFQMDHLVPHRKCDLLFYVPMHDRYHRGNMTQIKYTYGVAERQGLL